MCIVFSCGIRNTETTITAVTVLRWDLRWWFHFFIWTIWYVSRQVLWIFENVLWFVLLLDWSSCLLDLVVYCKAKSRQLIISSSWFESYWDYVANSWKDQAASQGGVVSGWLKGRPSDVVASAYVSSEIPLNSNEVTLTWEYNSCLELFQPWRIKLGVYSEQFNICLDLGRNPSESELNRDFWTGSGC